jgi:hypothetical protein
LRDRRARGCRRAGRRLWLPLLDGAERLGVLGLTIPRADDALRVQCTWLATLISELLITKGPG